MQICFLSRTIALILLSYATAFSAAYPVAIIEPSTTMINPSPCVPEHAAAFAQGVLTGICVTPIATLGPQGANIHPLATWASFVAAGFLCSWAQGRVYETFCNDYDTTAKHILACIPSKHPQHYACAQAQFRKEYIALRTNMAEGKDFSAELAVCDTAYQQIIQPGLPVTSTSAIKLPSASPTAQLHNSIYAQAYALLENQSRVQGFAVGAALSPIILTNYPYLFLPFLCN